MSEKVPLLSLGNIDTVSHRLRKLGLSADQIKGKIIADVGSGVSDFPEQIVMMGAQSVNAVDPIYASSELFREKNIQTRLAVERIIHSLRNGPEEKIHAHKMIQLLDSSMDRFMKRSQNGVHHLSSHNDLGDESQDIIFLNNMLKAIPDYEVFLSELMRKVRSGGAIYITEYAGTEGFCGKFAPNNRDWVKHLSDDDFDDPHEYYRITKV